MSHVLNLRGIDMHVHPPGEFVSDAMRASGDFYEADILAKVSGLLNGMAPGVLVDVGAMIGTHTAFWAQFVDYVEIHAFEPCRENFALLYHNTNKLSSMSVYLHSCALSDRTGHPLAMGFSPDNMGHAAAIATNPWHDQFQKNFSVDTAQLDDFDFQNVRLLKVDVEGHEAHVLRGARKTIERCRPLILLEDWARQYADLLPGYRVAAEWFTAHQTFLYEPIP